MASYISSNNNRFYAAIEQSYGKAQAVDASNRFPAVHVKAAQVSEVTKRLDKTGSRTYQKGTPTGRTKTAFHVQSFLTAWNGQNAPAYGPLFQAACGGAPTLSPGVIVNTLVNPTEIVTSTPHGLQPGAGLSWSNEIRFVTQVLNAYTIIFNAPFITAPTAGVLLGPTATYRLSGDLPSFTLYDYWDTNSTVSRLLCGCAVDSMDISINGDYHEFSFAGTASDLLDAVSFSAGNSGLTGWPAEPALAEFNGSGVPGHLGEIWVGTPAAQFATVTRGTIQLRNNLNLRSNEFGLLRPDAVVPGRRAVSLHFSLLVQNDNQTTSLYRAAKQQQSFPLMLQLGAQQGQLMGVYLPQVTAEVPDYNDGSERLIWDFQNGVAQGVTDDELYIAFA